MVHDIKIIKEGEKAKRAQRRKGVKAKRFKERKGLMV